MNNDRILITEISGRRPGDKNKRPTEKFNTIYDKVIISNNSDGYETSWDIVNVPEYYKEYYMSKVKNSERAWYAPMNRSYAIKYARERGYKYLVQLDDNIVDLGINIYREENGIKKRFQASSKEMLDDFIMAFVTVLKNTNAGMVGCQLSGCGIQKSKILSERYVYSIFALDLDMCPDEFQGDFEDDIEYRLKFAQMGIPVVQIVPFIYGKTGQISSKDSTGCREEYARVGLNRGNNMKKLYGEVYSCRLTSRSKSTACVKNGKNTIFSHNLKKFKVGIISYDTEAIVNCINEIILKYAKNRIED